MQIPEPPPGFHVEIYHGPIFTDLDGQVWRDGDAVEVEDGLTIERYVTTTRELIALTKHRERLKADHDRLKAEKKRLKAENDRLKAENDRLKGLQ